MQRKMPNGVVEIYFIEAICTFSYAILYSSLSLYLTRQLGFSNTMSNAWVGLFLALNYILHLVSGVIGGRYISNRSLCFYMIVFQVVGTLCLASLERWLLLPGLSFFLVGCGLGTTCFNNMMMQRFQSDDPNQEIAFLHSYMAMNIGFLSGFIFSGFFDYSNQYQILFYAATITNVIVLIIIWNRWGALSEKSRSRHEPKGVRNVLIHHGSGYLLPLLLVPLLVVLFKVSDISNSLVLCISVCNLIIVGWIGKRQNLESDKQKIHAFMILAVISVIFWMIYFTGPMGVTLFIKNNVDRQWFGFRISTQWLMNINALITIAGSPILIKVLAYFRSKGYEVTTVTQFVTAFILMGISFLILAYSINAANQDGYTSMTWVILHFLTEAFAELLIGPMGYAMIGQIAPSNLKGFMMGSWMMVSGVAASLSHYFSNAMTKAESTNPLLTNADYQHVFYQLGIWVLAGALVLFCISRKLNTLLNSASHQSQTNSQLTGDLYQ